MTDQPRALFTAVSDTDKAPLRRYGPGPKNRTFAAVAAAPLLLANLPVAYDATLDIWKRWDKDALPGEGDQIRGFLHCDLQTHATNTVQAEILFEGEFDVLDINTSAIRAQLPNTPSSNDVIAALRDPDLRALKLIVRDVGQV